MLAQEIRNYLSDLSELAGVEEDFRFGDPKAEVTGVLICWLASGAALRKAAEENCNLVICHEDLFYPYAKRSALDTSITWRVNQRKIKIMAEQGITVVRAHGALDRLCIFDDFATVLGLGEPAEQDENYSAKVYQISPTPLRELAQRAKSALGIEQVRVIGGLDRLAERICLPWGGVGLGINISYWEDMVERFDPDTMIAGEVDEYALHYAIDSGLGLIETGHCASENPGLRTFTQRLEKDFPDLKVVFFDTGQPWEWA